LVYVCAYGGNAQDIAEAIFTKKSQGCDMNGNTSVTVYDKDGYIPPYPEYTIKFQIPDAISLSVKISLAESNFLPSDIIQQVKKAVLAAFNGQDGGTRARIANTLYSGRYYAGIYAIDPAVVNILSVQLSRDGTSYGDSVSFGIDEIPTLDENNIDVELI